MIVLEMVSQRIISVQFCIKLSWVRNTSLVTLAWIWFRLVEILWCISPWSDVYDIHTHITSRTCPYVHVSFIWFYWIVFDVSMESQWKCCRNAELEPACRWFEEHSWNKAKLLAREDSGIFPGESTPFGPEHVSWCECIRMFNNRYPTLYASIHLTSNNSNNVYQRVLGHPILSYPLVLFHHPGTAPGLDRVHTWFVGTWPLDGLVVIHSFLAVYISDTLVYLQWILINPLPLHALNLSIHHNSLYQ